MSEEGRGYRIVERLHQSGRTIVLRAEGADGGRVILKGGRGEEPRADLAARLQREHAILSRLDSDRVVRSLGPTIGERGDPMLAFADIGGAPLASALAGDPPSLAERLDIAAALASGLGHIHERGVIHRNLACENVVVDRAGRRINIVGFGAAAELTTGSVLSAGATLARAALSSIAPEQTGRMNQPVDHRADLYSLGAVLYELFAGRPPFESADEVELLHAHLAKQPTPLCALDPAIPSVVGDIVMKLLMKRAEDRYQRAAAAAADLARCASRLAATGAVAPFAIGATDSAPLFEPLTKLYGRRAEIDRLRAALAAAREGGNEAVTIAGAPGAGKSALASEIRTWLVDDDGRPNGHFGFGKCEQSLRDSPYHGLMQGFEAVIRAVLTEPDAEVARWRSRLLAALGKGAGVILDLVPALEALIGPQPPPPPLPAAEARHRLTQAARAFVAAFASPDCPLVLVLDDAQWADGVTMALLGPISAAPEAGGLVLIVVHRDDDADAAAALQDGLAGLRAQAGGMRALQLDPLGVGDVEEMLTDALRAGPRTRELAGVVHAKTHGNPLFVRQFLKHLVDRGLIGQTGEAWDMNRIASVQATDNVVGFLVRRMHALPRETQRLVAVGACLGMTIDAEAIATALDLDRRTVALGFVVAVAEGMATPVEGGYAFTHDRIREAAYSLLDDRERCHRRLGAALLARLEQGDPGASVFAVAGQLNRGGDLGDDPCLRARCAEANFAAARQARASAAFASAREHAEAGLRLTAPSAWSSRYEAIAEASLLLAECHVLNRDHAAFEAMFADLMGRLADDERRLRLHRLKVLSLGARSLWGAALEAGLAALGLVGIDLPIAPADAMSAIPAEIAQFQEAMAGRPPRALIELAPLADPRLAAAMRLALQLAPYAHNAMRPDLFALLAIRNANLMMRHGRDLVAPGVIMTLALTLRAITGDIPQVDALAQTAIALDRAEGGALTAVVTFGYAYFLHHWLHPIERSLPLLLDGVRAGFEMGDIEFGSFHAATYVIHLGFSGAPLEDVLAAGRRQIQIIAGHNATATSHCELEIRFAEALLGRTAGPTSLLLDHVETVAETLARGAAMAANERGYFFARSLRLAYLFGAHEAAFAYGEAFLDSLPGVAGNFVEADGVGYFLLAALATGKADDPRFLRERDRLRGWSGLNPHNFGAMQALVDAEQARVDGRAREAIGRYGEAARIADAGGAAHLSALVNECAGRHYLALGDDIAALARLREAVALNRHWGAQAKARALEAEFPALAAGRAGGADADSAAPRTLTDEGIDFRAVLRAAQTISRQIDLRRLPRMALAAIEESAGAEYGALVLRRPGGGLHVEVASRHGATGDDETDRGEPIERSDAAPRSVVAYVAHTGQPVVLDNAQRSPEFAADPYIRSRGVASVLCAPITEHGQLRGIVYLENNLAGGVFTPRRLEVVLVLAAQAAIAIANANLFVELESAQEDLRRANEGLERKVEARTAELAAARNKAIADEEEARRAWQAAEAANQAKSRFLAVIGHEIRTPMNGILGMLQLLDGERLDAQQRGYLEIAADSGKTLLSLIDGIFDYARLEAEGETLDIQDFDLRRLLTGAIELIRPQAVAKQLAIDLTIGPPAPPRLRGDPNRLSRVAINLLGNAVKFTPSGRIDVKAWLEPGAAPMLHLVVADTGIGVAPEMHERIFADFVQADDSIARRFGGAGLGLAISRRIARLMGGALTIESALGAGSTFHLATPIALAAAVAAGATNGAGRSALSVLVVDDDRVNRTVAAGLLGRLGHRVALAVGGPAAVEAAAAHDFDVVLMDLHMPGVDGLETTRRIRALPQGRCRDVPVIALTADLTQESRRRCALAGIQTVLGKPLQFGALRRALAALDREAGRGSPPAPALVDPSGLIDGKFLGAQFEILGAGELARLGRMFQRNSLKTIASMEADVAAGDRKSVQALAHRLRSAAGALGLAQLCDSAATVESLAGLSSSGDLPHVVATLRPLRRASIAAFNLAARRVGAPAR